MKRMCSGTSVPGPRTSRTISPRRTESTHRVARSTVGAAGFKLVRKIVSKMIAPAPMPAFTYRPVLGRGGRGMSTSDYTKHTPYHGPGGANAMPVNGLQRELAAAPSSRRAIVGWRVPQPDTFGWCASAQCFAGPTLQRGNHGHSACQFLLGPFGLDLMRHLTLAFRTLFKTPFVTAIAVVSLALGIGANAAIFSLFD